MERNQAWSLLSSSPRGFHSLLQSCQFLGCHSDNIWETPQYFYLNIQCSHMPEKDSSTTAGTCISITTAGTLPVILSGLYPSIIRANPGVSKIKQIKPVFICMLRVEQISKSTWLQKHHHAWSKLVRKQTVTRSWSPPMVNHPLLLGWQVFFHQSSTQSLYDFPQTWLELRNRISPSEAYEEETDSQPRVHSWSTGLATVTRQTIRRSSNHRGRAACPGPS